MDPRLAPTISRSALLAAAACAVGFWGAFTPAAWARLDVVPGSRYTSGRAAALGDAFIPLADDGASGLFYNPAGIGKIRTTQFEPVNLGLQVNSDYLGMVDRNFYQLPSLSGYAPTISGAEPAAPGFSAALFPNGFTRGFAFGVLMQAETRAQAQGANLRYRSLYQFIPTVGGALRLASGVVRLGYSLQWVNQASGDRTVPLSSPELGYNQGLAEGSALSHNVGFALTLPYQYLPSLNIVARNLLGAKFGSYSLVPLARNKSGTPADEPASYDASISYVARSAAGSLFNFVFEFRDLTNTSAISVLGRAVAGIEWDFRGQFYLRGGWRDGYPSAGLGLRRRTSEVSLSWYSEEAGTSYHDAQDTRWILHYQIRAF
jgi:hypothetical protein